MKNIHLDSRCCTYNLFLSKCKWTQNIHLNTVFCFNQLLFFIKLLYIFYVLYYIIYILFYSPAKCQHLGCSVLRHRHACETRIVERSTGMKFMTKWLTRGWILFDVIPGDDTDRSTLSTTYITHRYKAYKPQGLHNITVMNVYHMYTAIILTSADKQSYFVWCKTWNSLDMLSFGSSLDCKLCHEVK